MTQVLQWLPLFCAGIAVFFAQAFHSGGRG
jgi:hypothetical protein